MVKKLLIGVSCFLCLTTCAFASTLSIGEDGINSKATGLTGQGSVIGQAEDGRPGKPDHDTLDEKHHDQTIPTQVYSGAAVDGANSSLVMEHGTQVAGIMIAKPIAPTPALEGVAPEALLHSSSAAAGRFPDEQMAIAMQHIAKLPNMLAVNLSFGQFLGEFEEPDGTHFYSSFVDWSAKRHNVLYVAAGPENRLGLGPELAPADNFNGITVGTSQPFNGTGPFRQVGVNNDFSGNPPGAHAIVDILAPGENLNTTGLNNATIPDSGTSLAAPHVTGTVALLGQYAQQQKTANNPRFAGDNYKRPEVFKSVLLNSADKLDDELGSNRTILDSNGQDWTQSAAWNNPFIPLDDQMGAGHLNSNSALTQYKSGEYDPSTLGQPSTYVPSIGWDFHEIGDTGTFVDYIFDGPISGYIAVTLTWQRNVEMTSPGDTYHVGDQFFPYGDLRDVLSDLDLYVMPAESNDLNDAVLAEFSAGDSVEHIFGELPSGGDYKIRVYSYTTWQGFDEFGIAWRTGSPSSTQAGDFDLVPLQALIFG